MKDLLFFRNEGETMLANGSPYIDVVGVSDEEVDLNKTKLSGKLFAKSTKQSTNMI